MKSKQNVKKLALIGMLGGLSAILMVLPVFHFPIPFLPPFMDFDLASVPELIGGFVLGPLAAVGIVFVKLLVKFAFVGTSTMFTGEISNFILSLAFVLPAVIWYRMNRTKKRALQGMLMGLVCTTLLSVLTNYYFIFPFYAALFGKSMEELIAMCTAVNPLMKEMTTVVLFGIVPFNIIKFSITSAVAYLLYKKVSPSLSSFVR